MRRKKSFFFSVCYIICLVLGLAADAAYSQTVARNHKNKPAKNTPPAKSAIEKQKLFTVLRELNQVKGIYFLFSDKSFGDLLVTPVPDMTLPVEEILSRLLKDHNLKFRKLNVKTYIIVPVTEKETTATSAESSSNQVNGNLSATSLIRGKVIASDGTPLHNVNVLVKGTSRGIVTNADGFFEIRAAKGEMLIFSFVGYAPMETPVQKQMPALLVAQLNRFDKEMDQVVVTSLGVKKAEKSLGYAYTSVTAEQVTASGNTNFASALYGKSAGVKVSTAPGGATSAVQVQVRGLNSLNYNSQPLYVVDGIIIRNTNEKGIRGVNNYGYWDDQRIRGNGILDVNPLDIESITILKGASATALYGSEAASGVVVISTKKGSARNGLGIQLNYTGNVEAVAFLPEYQNVYGPGYDRTSNLSEGATEEGWVPADLNGDGVNESLRPNFRAHTQFGPKMEGQMVQWWDGKLRPYSPQPDNYRNLYRNGFNSMLNAAVSNQNEKASYRFSYTRNDYKGIQIGGSLQRNTFNVNSSFKLSDKITTDVVLNYINSKVYNRPYQLSRLIASYSGFFSRAEDVSLLFDRYQTSAGYKWVPRNQQQRNPDEALEYEIKNETPDYLWNQLRNSEVEAQHRLLASITFNYAVAKNLSLRGRMGSDLTSLSIESKAHNEYPVEFNSNTSTGNYGIADGKYAILYGDLLLSYEKKISKNIGITLNAGYQARDEQYRDQSSTTSGGLVKENWFSLSNSYNSVTTKLTRSFIFKNAFLGFVNFNYKDLLFIEGTGRQENSSTLPPGRNSYFYPSVNSSFIISEAFTLPRFISYAKIRASYGVVGNAPPAYTSGVAYTQTTLPTINGPVASLSMQVNAGNNDIRPENKYEMEFGFETRMMKNRFGIDITYYDSRTIDQILQLTVPASSSAISKLVNAGELHSRGVELGMEAIPIAMENFKWRSRVNAAIGKTWVARLDGAVKEIIYFEGEQNAIRIVANEGQAVGNIYVYPRLTDTKGNFVIGTNGLYVMDNSQYKKVGNVMPTAIGGWSNSFSFKNFTLDLMIDYRFGGKLVSPALKYNIGAGIYKSTLKYRDAGNGGLSYYIDNSGEKILLTGTDRTAPDGAKIYDDGLILDGATISGEKNTKIVDAAYYYRYMFEWGANAWNEEGAIYDNSFIKMREAVFAYTIPLKENNRMHFNRVRISLIGRNLFYFWKTVKNLDPEAPIGTNWVRQNIDEGTSAATRSYGISVNLSF